MPKLATLVGLVLGAGFVIGLGLAGCDLFEMSQPAEQGAVDMQGWRFASGKAPSRAEYTAMVAACQDGAVRLAQPPGSLGPLDACLADLGLKRAP